MKIKLILGENYGGCILVVLFQDKYQRRFSSKSSTFDWKYRGGTLVVRFPDKHRSCPIIFWEKKVERVP